ncbi:PPW family C-terminal domain-containing PPE protein, partial [Agromyces sp. NPDC055658]
GPAVTAPPRVEASARGTGKQGAAGGFAGTRHNSGVADAEGLVTLESDPLRGGPTNPLLPGSWREG